MLIASSKIVRNSFFNNAKTYNINLKRGYPMNKVQQISKKKNAFVALSLAFIMLLMALFALEGKWLNLGFIDKFIIKHFE